MAPPSQCPRRWKLQPWKPCQLCLKYRVCFLADMTCETTVNPMVSRDVRRDLYVGKYIFPFRSATENQKHSSKFLRREPHRTLTTHSS